MDLTKLTAELTRDEGKRNKPYKDSRGFYTVGIGHNLDANGLSDSIVNALFLEDVKNVCDDLNRSLPWWTGLDEVRQRGLVNACFNLGIEGLLKFQNTLKALKEGRYEDCANNLLANGKLIEQTGNRYIRIAEMFRTGQEPQ